MIYAKTEWKFRKADERVVDRLLKRFRIDPIVAQIMAIRGIDDLDRAEKYLKPELKRLTDPEVIPGVKEAAELIQAAIESRRTIIVYSDYDVDGVCGLTVLTEALRLAGAENVVPYIPHRVEEGYGLNSEAISGLAAEHPGALLITVDCGITAVEQVKLARSLGLDVIITDHHSFKPELPSANVLVHPHLPGGAQETLNLCGAGVAFKLAWQVAKNFGDGKKASPALRDFLVRGMGLVALATVADVMPLVDENRILVRHGLESLNNKRTLGMDALLRMSGVKPDKPVTTGTVGFQIAPRINAAGRMKHAFTAYELLTSNSVDHAQKLAEILEESNRKRRSIEAEIVSQSKAQFENDPISDQRNVVVLAQQGWHPGVVGIAASRMVELFHRPTILLSIDENGVAHGSGRSIPGLNLVELLNQCSSHMMKYGGHAAAAGLTLHVDSLHQFREDLDKAVGAARSENLGERVLWIDAEIPMSRLDVDFVRAIENLEPHGNGNPRPVLAMGGVELLGEPQIMGDDRKHVKMKVRQGNRIVKVLAWNKADSISDWQPGSFYDIAFSPSVNEWQGRVEVQAELKDIRPHQGV